MFDYMTITLAGGEMLCVFECPEYRQHEKTFSFGNTHIPKEYVQRIAVTRTPGGGEEVLLDRGAETREGSHE